MAVGSSHTDIFSSNKLTNDIRLFNNLNIFQHGANFLHRAVIKSSSYFAAIMKFLADFFSNMHCAECLPSDLPFPWCIR